MMPRTTKMTTGSKSPRTARVPKPKVEDTHHVSTRQRAFPASYVAKVSKRLVPQTLDLCITWRRLWEKYMEEVGETSPRRAALWIGHSTLRGMVAGLAKGQSNQVLQEVCAGTQVLWEFGIGTDDLSHMVTFYEEVVVKALRSMFPNPKVLLKAAGAFDEFFHLVFSSIFHTYSTLDRSRKARPSGLTRREEHILLQIGKGESSREIGKALKLSPRSVEAVRERLKVKLNCKTGADLVRHALLLDPSFTPKASGSG